MLLLQIEHLTNPYFLLTAGFGGSDKNHADLTYMIMVYVIYG
jgi:hypothetical protein